MFSMVLLGSCSVSFDTDSDSGSSHFLIRIRYQGNDTDSTDPDPPHWGPTTCPLLEPIGSMVLRVGLEDNYSLQVVGTVSGPDQTSGHSYQTFLLLKEKCEYIWCDILPMSVYAQIYWEGLRKKQRTKFYIYFRKQTVLVQNDQLSAGGLFLGQLGIFGHGYVLQPEGDPGRD